MLRIRNIANASQARTLRVLYGPTQAYPYAAYLASTIYDAAGAAGTAFSGGAGTNPGTGGQGPIFPGMVAALTPSNENVCVAVGGTALRPFGLFGNFVGGDFDEIGTQTEVGVWRGPGSVYEILSPAFNSDITATAEAVNATNRRLYAGSDGRLSVSSVSSGPAVCTLIDYVSASKIVVEWTYAGLQS